MRDIPRYFAEQIGEMRAGLARGFTPPKVTIEGHDHSLTAVVDAKPEETLFYIPFKHMLPTVPAGRAGEAARRSA